VRQTRKGFSPHDDRMTYGLFLKMLQVSRQMPRQMAIDANTMLLIFSPNKT
jgi:hypothetical protein